MNGFKKHYLQGQSFGLTDMGLDGDFVNRNEFPKPNKNVAFDFMRSVNSFINQPFDDGIRTSVSSGVPISPSGNLHGSVAVGRFVYMLPRDGTSFVKINIDDDTVTNLGSFAATLNKWAGGCLGADGYTIYCVPLAETRILKINTQTDEVSYIETNTTGLGWRFPILHQNGYIYAAPVGHTKLIKINTAYQIDSVELVDAPDITGLITGVQYKQFIYYFPFTSSFALKYDTTSDSFTKIGNLTTSSVGLFVGGCLAPNGMIYAAPHGSSFFGKIDPTTDTLSLVGTSVGTFDVIKYNSLKVAPNGNMYTFPASGGSLVQDILRFTQNEKVSSVVTGLNSVKVLTVTLAENGQIFATPFSLAASRIAFRLGNPLPGGQSLKKRFYQNRNL